MFGWGLGIYFVAFRFPLPQDHWVAVAGGARAAFTFSLSIFSILSLTSVYMTPTPIAVFDFVR